MSKRLKRIHVNQHNIKANAKNGSSLPVFTVKDGPKNIYGDKVVIKGPSEVVYRPNRPLSCGARAWIETRAEVIVESRKFEAKPGYYYDTVECEFFIVYPDGSHEFSRYENFYRCPGKSCYSDRKASDICFLGGL